MLLGVGSGRNIPPLVQADLSVFGAEQDRTRASVVARAFSHDHHVRIVCTPYDAVAQLGGTYAGALATHALLHGTPPSIAAVVAVVRTVLDEGAPFFAALGSTADQRFGRGTRVAQNAFAAPAGPEEGVVHTFFDRHGVRALFAAYELESLEEASAAETAGAWAHEPQQAREIVHWFVRARVPKLATVSPGPDQ